MGLYLVACYLLVAAGASKAVRPDDTARALARVMPTPLRFPTVKGLVRIGAAAELVLGVVALGMPRPVPAWLVAASYGAFAIVVAHVRSSGGALASCGCFGTPDTPATGVHVVVDAVLCTAAVAVALARPAGATIWSVLARQPGHGVPLVLISGLLAWLCYLALTALAGLQSARALTSVTARHQP